MQKYALPTAISYRDSLNNFLALDPHWQEVINADKTYRFNPTEENAWWLGSAYWRYGYHLIDGPFDAYRLRKSIASFNAGIACYKTIKRRYEAAQKQIRKIRQNISHVRWRLEYEQ